MPRAATEKQLAVLRYIAHQTDKNGYSPTVREVGAEFGFSSLRGVTVHLDALERKGLLMRASSIARTMQVTSAGRQALGMAAEPADRFKILLEAVEQYRCLRRRYEELTTQPAMREIWKAMEPDLRAAREEMFCLLPAEEP